MDSSPLFDYTDFNDQLFIIIRVFDFKSYIANNVSCEKGKI